MADQEDYRLSYHQEALAVMIYDDVNGPRLTVDLDPSFFELSAHVKIAMRLFDYIRTYRKAPKEHIRSLLREDVEDEKIGSFIVDELNLFEKIFKTLNAEFVVSHMREELRKRAYYRNATKALGEIEAGRLDKAEGLFRSALQFSAGAEEDDDVYLDDLDKVYRSLQQRLSPVIPLGIRSLDHLSVGCREGELMLLMAPAKRGKSWWLIHTGKWANLAGQRSILHITLEMSKDLVIERWLQSIGALTSYEAKLVTAAQFSMDDRNRWTDFSFETFQRSSLRAIKDSRKDVEKLLAKLKYRPKILVKEFPTSSLTIGKLEMYLDKLDQEKHFHPGVIVLDYADLMRVGGSEERRIGISDLYKELRRIAMERKCLVVTATQTNRGSTSAKIIDEGYVAEDFSKIGTADLVMAYTQMPMEFKLGVARILVSNARNSEDRLVTLVSQAYSIGQFCLDSALVTDGYYTTLKSDESLAVRQESAGG